MFDLIPELVFPAILGESRRVLQHGGRLVLANIAKIPGWFDAIWE